MAAVPSLQAFSPNVNWSDARLVKACLDGNELAWAALIDKYRNLIYSIPVRYGLSPDDAADVFQSVCMELFSQLPRLRKVESMRSWLITVSNHKVYHWKRRHRRRAEVGSDTLEPEEAEDQRTPPQELVEAVEREQIVREALRRLSERCRKLIRLLFYDEPPRPYREVAQQLGLATGSIGFIRGRCLNRMQKLLEGMGL